jgi:RND family efflux transporter MFP subunit
VETWSHHRQRLAVRFAIVCAAVGILTACSERGDGKKKDRPPAPPVAVSLAHAESRAVDRRVDLVGTAFPDEEVIVSAKVPGKVTAMKKDVGDAIVSGELLAQIDTSDYQLAVEQKQMSVRESLGKIGLGSLPDDKFDVMGVPQVRRAKFQAENADARFQRAKQLFEQTPPRISAQEYGDIRTASEVAKNDMDIEVLTARTALDEARTRQAELNTAQRVLKDTDLTAPAVDAGRKRRFLVSAKYTSIGEFAREGTPVYRIVDIDLIKVRTLVPERYLTLVKKGQKAMVKSEAFDEPFEGAVSRINPQIDPASRNFEVEVDVPNIEQRFKPGAFVRVSILTHRDPHAIFVPRKAVTSFAGLTKCFAVDNGRAREVIVTLGEGDDVWVEVTKGLQGGETLTVGGGSSLVSGSEIVVRDEEAPTTKPDGEAKAKRGQ